MKLTRRNVHTQSALSLSFHATYHGSTLEGYSARLIQFLMYNLLIAMHINYLQTMLQYFKEILYFLVQYSCSRCTRGICPCQSAMPDYLGKDQRKVADDDKKDKPIKCALVP